MNGRHHAASAVEQLYGSCREFGHCHVVLDPQAGSPFADALAALDPESAPRVHLADPLFADAPEEAPLLVRLPLSQLPLIEALALQAQREATDPDNAPRSVCGFFTSDMPMDRVAARLAAALKLDVEGRQIYFRYFDPRVFHHLADLLPAPSLGALLRGIRAWCFFAWDGSLLRRDIPDAGPPLVGPLRLMLRPWQAFETIEHFNATQRLFARQGLAFEPAQATQLFAQVHAARSMGLSSPSDTAHFLACSRQATQPLPQHPPGPRC